MIVWKEWRTVKFGGTKKIYRMLLLFGFIPLFIYVNG